MALSAGGASRPGAAPPAGPGVADLHVWWMRVDLGGVELADLARLLSTSERERARAFRFDRDRVRYTAAHGMLRQILTRYTGAEPEAIELGEGRWGKPELAGALRGLDLAFNLTHSGDHAACVVGPSALLGIDMEEMRLPRSEQELLARNVFTEGERRELAGMSGGLHTLGFYRGWTRKEAYLKAIGTGLSVAPEQVEVTLGSRARLLATHDGSPESAWRLQDLRPPSAGYAAALALKGPSPRVRAASWPEGSGMRNPGLQGP